MASCYVGTVMLNTPMRSAGEDSGLTARDILVLVLVLVLVGLLAVGVIGFVARRAR
ncbi:hypothetical protein ACTMTI_53960 [Nonomuraea sp. H19]|uniref:hypothetical protein n=1 Tax=Nonomuraea sp. H19 TaxID=3452206 RepID=UPI003F88E17E